MCYKASLEAADYHYHHTCTSLLIITSPRPLQLAAIEEQFPV